MNLDELLWLRVKLINKSRFLSGSSLCRLLQWKRQWTRWRRWWRWTKMYGIVSKNMKYFNCLTKKRECCNHLWVIRWHYEWWTISALASQFTFQIHGAPTNLPIWWMVFFWSHFFQAFRVNIVYLSLFIDVDLVGSFQVSY